MNIRNLIKNLFFKNNVSQNDELQWLKRYNINTFIDIGAYIGEYIEFSQEYFPKAYIYAFEPLPECRAILSEKAINKKIKVFNFALGDRNYKARFFKSSYLPSSSLLNMDNLHKISFPHTAKISRSYVNVRRLDEIMLNEHIKPDIFIKIDTQGFEDKVLRGGKNTVIRAKVILIEVSFQKLYQRQILFHDIYRLLYEMGFYLNGFRNQIFSPKDGSILQAHAFFVKK